MPTADRILAVTFTVLLILSMVAPAALAADPAAVPAAVDTTDVSSPQPGGEDDSTFDENKSSLELRFEARELLRNASIRGGPNANQQLVERVNDSMDHYTGLNRADDVRIFDRDTQVISRTKKTAPEVSNRLLASQARLAETTMADANRTVNRLEEQGAVQHSPCQEPTRSSTATVRGRRGAAGRWKAERRDCRLSPGIHPIASAH